MPTSLLTVTEHDGTLEPVDLVAGETGGVEAVTTLEVGVGTGLAGAAEEGAASDDEFPIGIVLVTVLLIVAAVAAFALGFRSTRRTQEALEDPPRDSRDTSG